MVEEIDYAYLAGIVDGEGTIAIIKNKKSKRNTYRTDSYRLQLVVTNTNGDLMEWLITNFGGAASPHKGDKRNPNSKRWFAWHLHGLKAIKILTKIEPYLIIKHENVEVAFAFYDNCTKKSKTGRMKPKWLVDTCEMYYQQMKALNKTGVNNVEHLHKPLLKKTSSFLWNDNV